MASDNNMKAANASYDGFLNMLKVGIVAVTIVTVVVIALIS